MQSENIPLTVHPLEQRGLLHCQIQVPQRAEALHVFNVHLDLRSKNRRKQASKIIAHAQHKVPAHAPLILGGDFNDWGREASPLFHQSLQLQESFKHSTGKYSRSFPNFMPFFELDRLYSRHMQIHSVQTLSVAPWTKLSDHLPILVEFEI